MVKWDNGRWYCLLCVRADELEKLDALLLQ